MIFNVYIFSFIAKSLRRSLSADGSLSDSLNSDDLMLDIDYDATDDKLAEPDNDDLLKSLENNKQNAINEWKSLKSPRYTLIIKRNHKYILMYNVLMAKQLYSDNVIYY